MSLKPEVYLFFGSQNRVLGRFSDPKFYNGFSGNFDLLLRLGIEAHARFPLLLYKLTEARKDKFAGLFDLFVCQRAKRREEYAGCRLGGLSSCGKCELQFCLGHVLEVAYASGTASFQGNHNKDERK
jgi:hypothetical protein